MQTNINVQHTYSLGGDKRGMATNTNVRTFCLNLFRSYDSSQMSGYSWRAHLPTNINVLFKPPEQWPHISAVAPFFVKILWKVNEIWPYLVWGSFLLGVCVYLTGEVVELQDSKCQYSCYSSPGTLGQGFIISEDQNFGNMDLVPSLNWTWHVPFVSLSDSVWICLLLHDGCVTSYHAGEILVT